MSEQIRTDNSAVIERLERERDEWKAQAEAESIVADSYRNERDDLEHQMNMLQQDRIGLDKRKAELLTQVARLRQAGNFLMETFANDDAQDKWLDVVNESGEKALREIRAEAVEQCLTRIDQFATLKQDCMDEIQCFADEIRSGER